MFLRLSGAYKFLNILKPFFILVINNIVVVKGIKYLLLVLFNYLISWIDRLFLICIFIWLFYRVSVKLFFKKSLIRSFNFKNFSLKI